LSTAPCTKSLLSYLQHKTKDSDSSSVESDCESPTDNVEGPGDDFKLKEMSVSMARLSPEKLERISSRVGSLDSGGEDIKIKGFSDDSVMSIKQNKKNLGDLIENLETEIDVKHVLVSPACVSHESLEVVEDKDVVMRMVEDFSLLSESDSEEEVDNHSEVVIKSEMDDSQDHAPKDLNIMVWFPDGRSPIKKEVTKESFEKSILLTDVEEAVINETEVEYGNDAGSTHSESNEETLEEMLQRLENSSSVNKDCKAKKVVNFVLEDNKSVKDDHGNLCTEEFENEALAHLVSRMRRESRVDKMRKNRLLMDGAQKCKILEKCDYWLKKEENSLVKPYGSIILREPREEIQRLSKPTRDDVLKAREVLRINDRSFKFDEMEDESSRNQEEES